MQQLFLELLNIAIGNSDRLSWIPSESEWSQLFAISKQQAVLGFCYTALSKLPKEQFPPQSIFLQWLAFYNIISKRNQLLNDRCAQLQQKLQDDGFKHIAFLKGQTNAVRYPDPFCRQCGDIDVWVEGGKELVKEYASKQSKDLHHNGEHFVYDCFSDVSVELHYRLGYSRTSWIVKKTIPYFQEKLENNDFSLTLPNGKNISALDYETNIIHQLLHIFKHFWLGGIGFRQIIDFYFVLIDAYNHNVDFKHLDKVVKKVRLHSFAAALMSVLKEIFHLPESAMICKPNNWRGKYLLNEIFRSGNFGFYNSFKIKNKQNSKLIRKINSLFYSMRMFPYYPMKWLWDFVCKIKSNIVKLFKYLVR